MTPDGSEQFRLSTIAKELVAALIVLALCALSAPAASVDFDGVTGIPLVCDGLAEPVGDETPRALDLVGTLDSPPAEVAFDADFLYFRYRLDGDPTGPDGFKQYAWVALVQTPSGNPFQYQYMVAVNGLGGNDDFGNNGDTVEIWANTAAKDVEFDPLFQDPAETRLFSQVYTYTGAGVSNDGPLARVTVADSTFGDSADSFLDFAVPVQALVAGGVVADASELSSLLFLPAVSTNPNNYNKGRLDGCPFVPATDLTIAKQALPATIPANTDTEVAYALTVQNTGSVTASGVVIEDPSVPGFVTNVSVQTMVSAPSATVTVDSTSPVRVKVSTLPVGATAVVTISGTAVATCDDLPAMNTASAKATNALTVTASATLAVDGGAGSERCDGADNDCDGEVDENGPALCDDGNACTIDTCTPAGCGHAPIPGCVPCTAGADCNDGNACSTDFCDAGVCNATLLEDCIVCSTDADCDDGNACTLDVCGGETCLPSTEIDGCILCTTDADCSDGDACTIDACGGETCLPSAEIEGCVPCATGADCNDGNPCTDDVCTAAGVCDASPIDGCIPCAVDADCADADACTSDVCGVDGSCVVTTIPGCVPCDVDADCDDGNACTADACIAGACTSLPIEGCTICEPTAEVCGDGIDNDCDEATDCDDANCSAAPGCQGPVEICGDCIDNDDDGFIDLDDPDCGCAQPDPLTLKRLKIKSKKSGAKKFKVKALVADAIPVGFDPTTTGMQLQMSDVNGVVFCARFDEGWERRGRRRLKYRNKDKTTERLAGLKVARFKVARNGRVKFVAKGPNAELRDDITSDLKVSVLVGDRCTVSSAPLRTKKRTLVFP